MTAGAATMDAATADAAAADVVIVGAGASGSVAAARLAAAGFKVVCLEQGDWTGPADYMSASPEAELAWVQRWNPDPNARRGPADYPLTGDADVRPVMYNGVGGGLVQWAAMWQPLLASDFRVRTLDGVADDWPIGWPDLAAAYGRVARDMSVSGLGGDPALPEADPYPNPPVPIGRIGLAAARGMDRLGWHWWPGSNAIASRRHGSLQACQRRGTCMLGCPENAKATPSLTHWPSALAAGARLVTGARVARIPLDERGRARGAVYLDRDGVEHFQRAQVVVLAGNAVGTARLLLLSASPRFPDGLANSSGLVGRRLMQHPYRTVTAVCEEPLESWQGPWGQSIYSLEFAETDPGRDFVRGAKWMVMPHGGPMFAVGGVPGGPPPRRLRRGVGPELPPGGGRGARPRLHLGHPGRGPARRRQPGGPRPRGVRLLGPARRPHRVPGVGQHPPDARLQRGPSRGGG